MRIVVPLVIEMTDEQVDDYADDNGLPLKNGKVMARDVVADVRAYVLHAVQESPSFGGERADVSIKER